MQFTRLMLQDYGIYGGTTDIDLAPDVDRPVILFGGRNGAGKTTLFESILVCLYGAGSLRMMRAAGGGGTAAAAAASAAAAGGGRRAYERLLESRLHRARGAGGRVADRASVTVRFAAFIGAGKGTEYEVRRSWRAAATGGKGAKRITESLAVGRRTAGTGGEFEPVDMESRWESFISDLAPSSVAGLFFFDGEFVSRIARQYGGYAGEAFKSALGLDVVEKLQSDLLANASREEAAAGGGGGKPGRDASGGQGAKKKKKKKKYAELEAERAKYDLERRELAERLEQKTAELAGLRSEVLAAEKGVESLHGDGGDEPADAQSLERAILDKEGTESRILSMCEAPEYPLSLLPPDMVFATAGWLAGIRRRQVERIAAWGGELAADMAIADVRATVEADRGLQDAERRRMLEIVDGVAESRRGALAAFKSDGGAPLPPAARAPSVDRALGALEDMAGGGGSAQMAGELRALCARLSEIRSRMSELESSRSIREHGRTERSRALHELAELASRAGSVQSDVARLESGMRAAAASARAANSKMREALKTARRRGGSDRKSELRSRVLDALDMFASRMQSTRTRRLEDALLQNIRILMHKKAVERVEIDAGRGFAIKLYGPAAPDGGGAAIPADPADGMSEGERQMFAVSVIWALAKTSGRPLPFVIDTPLARLDAAHRSSMIGEFLPGCSHQVLVLSTDSEIDGEAYSELLPRVARSYVIEYVESEGRAVCRPGYFWDAGGADGEGRQNE